MRNSSVTLADLYDAIVDIEEWDASDEDAEMYVLMMLDRRL